MSIILWDIFVLLTLIIPGAIIYVIDDLLGTAIYAFLFKLFHAEGLPVGTKRGLICGRPTSGRLWQAALVALLTYKLFGYMYATVTVTKIFIGLLGFFGAFVGFWFGPIVSRLWRKKDKALSIIDRIESGEIDLSETAKQATQGAGKALSDAWEEAQKHMGGVKVNEPETPADEQAESAPTEAPPETEEETEEKKVERARQELHDMID